MTRKKKGHGHPPSAAKLARRAERENRKDRRKAKLEHRKTNKRHYTADQWALPAPSHLVAKLEPRKLKSKYHSYFEFAENTEKKKNKLEYQVTDDAKPQPGFKFVPIGDPILTNECKDISRELGAMIFIVSASKEENSKISEHMYRTGYHFRESIVDQALEKLGERTISAPDGSQLVEPIPESQDEINTQADAAIRDLFPRIPHTDRQIIIEHAFKKGALFHGEPTVGLQPTIPLSRRVQLAVLAHIRHTHTRYDRLLRETTWMNARKAVEPVCLDVLVKWRGDEETGRDQMDEILREVVIITDSEDSDDSSDEDDTSDDEGEMSSASSGDISNPNSRNQMRPALHDTLAGNSGAPLGESIRVKAVDSMLSSSHQTVTPLLKPQKERREQRGFKRYQAAWDQALRRQGPNSLHANSPAENRTIEQRQTDKESPSHNASFYTLKASPKPRYHNILQDQTHRQESSMFMSRQDPYYSQHSSTSKASINRFDEVTVRPFIERPTHYQTTLQRSGTLSPSMQEQRLPPLVRGSPSHGLQDMLVPSIETGSSDALVGSPRPAIRRDAYVVLEQSSYPRPAVERRRHEPELRQVILIEDDSPHHKRRRVIQEDNSGRFRPLPSHEKRLPVPAPYTDSHLMPASSVHSRDFLVQHQRISSQPSQGLFRDNQPPLADRIPIYDAQTEPGYPTPSSGPLRRVDVDFGSIHQQEMSHVARHNGFPNALPNNLVGMGEIRESVNNMRVVEREHTVRRVESDLGHRSQIRQLPLPNFSAQSKDSRSYEMGPGPVVADHTFSHNFSQSRTAPSLLRDGNGFSTSEHSYQNFVSPGSNDSQQYRDNSAGLPIDVRYRQERPQVQYMQRHNVYNSHYSEDAHTQQPALSDHSQPHLNGDHYITSPQSFSGRKRVPILQGNATAHMKGTSQRRQVLAIE